MQKGITDCLALVERWAYDLDLWTSQRLHSTDNVATEQLINVLDNNNNM